MERIKLNGFARITEIETGKVIAEAHNMIVKTGRQFIMKKIANPNDTTNIDKIYFSNGTNMTTEDDNICLDESGEKYRINDEYILYAANINPSNTAPSDAMYLHYSIQINASDVSELTGQTLSEIGLILSNNTLFSRLIHEPITLSASRSYKVDYYIYF